MSKFFLPDRRIESVERLTPETLRAWGIRSLLLDADCTLKRYGESSVAPPVSEWLDRMRSNGIGMCLLSNGRPKRIAEFARVVELPYVAMAMKPRSVGVRRAMAEQRFDPKRTAMVGDQIFADVLAGRVAGIFTILVRPIHPEEEQWFTRLKRPWERLVLRFWREPNDGKS